MRLTILTAVVIVAAHANADAAFRWWKKRHCDQEACVSPQQYCCPEEPAPKSGPPKDGVFTAPPLSGDVAGEARSLGLRLGRIRIPAINIPLPTIQLPNFVAYRRDAFMHLDDARAAFATEEPTRFGRLGPKDAPPKKKDGPPKKTHCCPQYYCQPTPCGSQATAAPPAEGIVSQHQERQLQAKSEQVARLERQVAQLQTLCQQLAQAQAAQLRDRREALLRQKVDLPAPAAPKANTDVAPPVEPSVIVPSEERPVRVDEKAVKAVSPVDVKRDAEKAEKKAAADVGVKTSQSSQAPFPAGGRAAVVQAEAKVDLTDDARFRWETAKTTSVVEPASYVADAEPAPAQVAQVQTSSRWSKLRSILLRK